MVRSTTGVMERATLTALKTSTRTPLGSVKSIAKDTVISILDSRLSLALTSVIDSRAIRGRAQLRDLGQASGPHVLINSTGGGNIGDQAMFESFLANVSGPVKVIVRSADAFDVPATLDRPRVELVILPRLVYGRGLARLRDVLAFGQVLRSARSLSIVGADVMDGGYGRRPSALEWSLAGAAAKAGLPTRVLGFSWKQDVDKQIQEIARRASRNGVVAIARDPHSRARLRENGIDLAVQAADVVFLHKGTPKVNKYEELLRGWVDSGRRVALLNMSGLIQAALDQNQEYGHIVRTLRELDYEIIMLPHVSTDIPVNEAFIASDPSYATIHYVDRLLTPSEVKALTAQAHVVVTGRMHLSILALSSGVPSIVLATQGKVLGLMELVGTPRFCIDPEVGFAVQVEAQLRNLETDHAETVATIVSGVEHARRLASVNFRGL